MSSTNDSIRKKLLCKGNLKIIVLIIVLSISSFMYVCFLSWYHVVHFEKNKHSILTILPQPVKGH